ncbi:MAG TPA: lipo-like protein, partial [Myxococcota bacterium]|nr:lipo-like protein [Myxococcota bacterium]
MPIRTWLTRQLLDWLSEPIPAYEQRVWNDPHALRRAIKKGDVLLVEGDNRISVVIKYLTQSS